MLDAGITVLSSSAWSFLVFIVSEKVGKPRFCVDYRTLNHVTVSDRWPPPNTEKIYYDSESSHVFTIMALFLVTA